MTQDASIFALVFAPPRGPRPNGKGPSRRGASPYAASLSDLFSNLFILSILLFSPISVAIPEQHSPSPATIETLLKQGKVNEALPLLIQLHTAQPQNVQICLQLGMVYTQLQQLGKAEES